MKGQHTGMAARARQANTVRRRQWRHEFWASVNFEAVGPWRIFERDGMWWMYKTRQNAESTAIASRDIASERAHRPTVDIWA